MSKARLPRGAVADQARSYREIESIARRCRERLGLFPGVRIDALEIFERGLNALELRLEGRAIEVITGVDSMTTEGSTEWDADNSRAEVLISAETHAFLEQDLPRGRYTVCHEMGHLVLHLKQLVRLASLPTENQLAFHRSARRHAWCVDTEWQANAFAGALLVPAGGISRVETDLLRPVTPGELADCFGVSIKTAGIRLSLYQQGKLQ